MGENDPAKAALALWKWTSKAFAAAVEELQQSERGPTPSANGSPTLRPSTESGDVSAAAGEPVKGLSLQLESLKEDGLSNSPETLSPMMPSRLAAPGLRRHRSWGRDLSASAEVAYDVQESFASLAEEGTAEPSEDDAGGGSGSVGRGGASGGGGSGGSQDKSGEEEDGEESAPPADLAAAASAAGDGGGHALDRSRAAATAAAASAVTAAEGAAATAKRASGAAAVGGSSGGGQGGNDHLGDLPIKDWSPRPGETIITHMARLYRENLDPSLPHAENCERLLRRLLGFVAVQELDTTVLRMRHLIKIETFLRLTALSVPEQTWGVAIRRSIEGNRGEADERPLLSQISENELLDRLSYFVQSMRALRLTDWDDSAADGARVAAACRGYAIRAAEAVAFTQRPATWLLPPVLNCLACDILAVRILGPEVREAVQRVVADFERGSKILWSPQQNAERVLRPLVASFAAWLRSEAHHDRLCRSCAVEGLVRSVDAKVRRQLKTKVYRSPADLVRTLEELRPWLTDVPLPIHDAAGGDDAPFDLTIQQQTLKDVNRETFSVDGVPADPPTCREMLRTKLAAAAAADDSKAASGCRTSDSGSSSSGGAANDGNVALPSLSAGSHSDAAPATCNPDAAAASRDAEEQPVATVPEAAAAATAAATGTASLVDRFVWRVLHAASRTASGGDAFFVVSDLFGGEGVLVKPASTAPPPIRVRIEGLAVCVTTEDAFQILRAAGVGSGEAPLCVIRTRVRDVMLFRPERASGPGRNGGDGGVGNGSGGGGAASWEDDDVYEKRARFLTIRPAGKGG